MSCKLVASSLLALTLVVGACQKSQPNGAAEGDKTPWGERILARVGTGFVTVEQLQRRVQLRQLESQRLDKPAPTAEAVLEEMVSEEVLVQQGINEGLVAREPDVRDRIVRRVLDRMGVAKPASPTDPALLAYYEAHRDQFPDEEMLHVRHILLRLDPGAPPAKAEEVRRKAEQLRAKAVAHPADFNKLAIQSSEDPTASHGGELGLLSTRRLELFFGGEFTAKAPEVKAGEVGPVVRSQQGYHVFQIVERRAPGGDPLQAHRNQLVAAYLRDSVEQKRAAYVGKLREQIPVQIDADAMAAARDKPVATAAPTTP